MKNIYIYKPKYRHKNLSRIRKNRKILMQRLNNINNNVYSDSGYYLSHDNRVMRFHNRYYTKNKKVFKKYCNKMFRRINKDIGNYGYYKKCYKNFYM